jgi:small conductance mechanosensitive channel
LWHHAPWRFVVNFRPFRIGDSIEVAGKSGTVKNLNLFMTELASGDNVQVVIPNGQVWGAAVTNFSAYGTRRISLSVPVMLDKDVETISSRLRRSLKEDKRVLDSPPPSVTASNLTDKGVEFLVQAWAKTEDADAVRNDFVRHSLAAVQAPTCAFRAHRMCRRRSVIAHRNHCDLHAPCRSNRSAGAHVRYRPAPATTRRHK